MRISAEMNKALFLDRDGVVNVDKGHVFLQDQFEFSKGIFGLCREYSDDGFLILIITNQAGIAKGLYTEADFARLTKWMVKQFRKNRIIISKVYYCPHHPDINEHCECRKPAPGMILQAIKEFDLNISECVLIGDKDTDLEAGRRAGIPESNLHLLNPPLGGKLRSSREVY
jgi:D-glycero-D-manno-heptose 1,7-bisphosphate phosphatase